MPLDRLSEVQDAPGTAEHYQRNDCANHEVRVRIPLMADSDSIPIADSVPGDGGHVARVS